MKNKTIHKIKYICTRSVGLLYLTMQIVFGQDTNQSFLQKANEAGIDLNAIQQQNTISRYDVTRLLNAVECVDCINPSSTITNKYINNFWTDFTALAGKDFDDIFYKQALYKDQSYYYCVATVADKEYMFGYPLLTSPTCPGQFCGAQNMSRGEFIQTITNILSKYIRNGYRANRDEIKTWYDKQVLSSYSYNVFNENDKFIIDSKATQCNDTQCDIGGPAAFRTYLKYCMFNIQQCNMQDMGRITQGYWPIAELNIINKEKIVDIDATFTNNIHAPIDGNTAVKAFGKIFEKVQCKFDTDYDCDGIYNAKDNCPNIYNPSQIDTDGDNIGDVCDDDIDGDGIKNPIGIVDERGMINITLRNQQTDNCIYIKNTNQSDKNSNYKGDLCDLDNTKGVAIGATANGNKINAYVITDYSPIESDRVRTINNETFYGRAIEYPIKESGLYTIYLQSTKDTRRKASTTIIGTLQKEYYNSNLSLSLSKSFLPALLTVQNTSKILPYTTTRTLEGAETQTKTTTTSQESVFLLRKSGNYTVTSTIKQGDDVLSVASRSFSIDSDENIINNIVINNQNPTIGDNLTLTTNITVKSWTIDRGDTTKSTYSKNNISHVYSKAGTYIISSTIVGGDDKTITDYKTIVITDKNKEKESNKLLQTRPKTLESYNDRYITLLDKRIGYSYDTVSMQLFYDGIAFTKEKKENIGIYQKEGLYYPEIREILGLCKVTSNQTTVVINTTNSCLDMKTKNIAPECDFDKDNIDDRCDDDIDGDGVKNPIGLILQNDASCDLSKAIIDQDKRKSMMKQLQAQYKMQCKALDNCPLVSNSNQESNSDGIGSACLVTLNPNIIADENNKNSIDSDGDGIPDYLDMCPDIKETYNGFEDEDGCPELGDNNPCSGIQGLGDSSIGFECLQCPCQYVAESSDINPGDSVRASLRNNKGTILQSQSTIKTL